MLLQSLLLVVALALIGSALLTSTLVSAKSTFHEMALRQSQSAMADATASLISWAQDNVRQNGIDQLPVWAAKPQTIGPERICGDDGPVKSSNASVSCKVYRTISWSVTGYVDKNAALEANNLTSEATNLATAQNEGRISATINVAITDASGSFAYARQSRQITARVFHAFPYFSLTAVRDPASEAGSITAAEGDSAGFARQTRSAVHTAFAPTSEAPAAYTKTNILTTIDCANSKENMSENPQLDNNDVAFAQLRQYGNMAWSYEVPCKSSVPINVNTAPKDYVEPDTNLYGNSSSSDSAWAKNDDNYSSFGR